MDFEHFCGNCTSLLITFRGAGTKNKLGAKQQAPKDRDAEGVEGRGMGRGFPLPVRPGGMGERRELSQRGKTNLVHSDALRRPLVAKIHKVL